VTRYPHTGERIGRTLSEDLDDLEGSRRRVADLQSLLSDSVTQAQCLHFALADSKAQAEVLESALCGMAFVLGQRLTAHRRYLDEAKERTLGFQARGFPYRDPEVNRHGMAVAVLRIWAEDLGLGD
jgi:hypothetical protein